MAFVKLSKTERLACWEADGAIQRTAGLSKTASYFAEQQNTASIDVGTMLQKVAGEYDISPNPRDYIFEAVRAVTAGVPNENGDAFHKNELLRYDHRLRQAVYQTFILKPHHVNHRADNPKTARGVILDAHYNDSTPALETCPKDGCGNHTAAVEGRDSTGLYCRKCGSTAKDEFVEILIAVDKSKDPNFAEGVRTGVLNATSMGCVCDSTTCNVCDHIAYNRNEFCTHIRSGNKKKTFKTAAGDKIAFEWCNNVVFTEDSRVDQPADPKALQQEILSLAARKEAMVGDLSRETDVLILQKQINELQARVAQMTPPTQLTPQVTPGDSAVPQQPGSIEQYVHEQDTKVQQDPPMTKEEMGILDSPAVAPDGGMGTKASVDSNIINELDGLAQRYASQHRNQDEGAKMELKFRTAYKNVRAAITSRGKCRVYTPAGTLFVIQPTEPLTSMEGRKAFSTTVLAHIAEHGLIPTMRSFEAAKGPKFAQILEHHLEDFAKGRETGDTKAQCEGGDDDMQPERETPDGSLIGDQESDRKDMVYDKKTMNDSALGGHQEDFEGKNREDKSFPGSVQDGGKPTQSDGYSKKTLSDSPLDNITLDHQHKVASKESSKPSASKPSASKPSASKPAAPKASASKPSASKPASSKPPSKTGAPPESPKAPSAGAPPPAAAPAPVPGAPAPAPAMPPAAPGAMPGAADMPGAAPGPEMLQQHWVAIEAMIAEMTAAGLPPELAEKAKMVAAALASGAASPAMEQSMSELEAMLPQIMEGMATPDNAMMLMDQMLAAGAPAPAVGGAAVTASKKGLPSFIKNKRGGSGDTKTSRPSISSKEKANSGGGHGSKNASLAKEAELKTLELRMERLYKGRIAKLKEEATKREAALTEKLAEKLKRALRVAAKRQALNLEQSPIKAAFADVLLTPMDLGGGEYYPGMDESLTVTLVERAASLGMDEFIDKIVLRASELMKASDETFGHIEADLKNLQPVMPSVDAPVDNTHTAEQVRTAARSGNLPLAPSASDAPRHDRSQLQAALGGTKVQRQHGRTFSQ